MQRNLCRTKRRTTMPEAAEVATVRWEAGATNRWREENRGPPAGLCAITTLVGGSILCAFGLGPRRHDLMNMRVDRHTHESIAGRECAVPCIMTGQDASWPASMHDRMQQRSHLPWLLLLGWLCVKACVL